MALDRKRNPTLGLPEEKTSFLSAGFDGGLNKDLRRLILLLKMLDGRLSGEFQLDLSENDAWENEVDAGSDLMLGDYPGGDGDADKR